MMSRLAAVKRVPLIGLSFLLVSTLLGAGCSDAGAPPGTGASGQSGDAVGTVSPADAGPASTASSLPGPSEPPYQELSQAADYGETPEPMAQTPSTDEVENLADGGTSRRDAESFAIGFAQLQSDTRDARNQADFVEKVLAREAAPSLRAYLLQDYEVQRQAGSERHYDPNSEAWLRSAAQGGDDAPVSVSVEIAAVLVSEPLELRFTNRSRVDVVREDDGWRVLSYAWTVTGSNLENGQSPDFEHTLKGPGWRRVS